MLVLWMSERNAEKLSRIFLVLKIFINTTGSGPSYMYICTWPPCLQARPSCVSRILISFLWSEHKNVSPVNVSISHHFSSECKNFITIKAWIWHKKRFEKFKMYFLSTSLFLKFSLSIYILNIYSYVKN